MCVCVTEEEYWSDDFDDDADDAAQGKQQNSKPFFPNSAKHTNPPHDPPRPHTYRRYGNEPPEQKRLPSLSPAADGPIGRDDLYSGTQEVAVTGDDGGLYEDVYQVTSTVSRHKLLSGLPFFCLSSGLHQCQRRGGGRQGRTHTLIQGLHIYTEVI